MGSNTFANQAIDYEARALRALAREPEGSTGLSVSALVAFGPVSPHAKCRSVLAGLESRGLVQRHTLAVYGRQFNQWTLTEAGRIETTTLNP